MVRPNYRPGFYSYEIYHFGVKHRSGRYPYGSGERPYQGCIQGNRAIGSRTL